VNSNDRQEVAFRAATAMVTCMLNGDPEEARRIAYSEDVLHEDMLLILAGALAAGHTPKTWQQAILAAHQQD
jgi:hypothetical protein